MSAAWNEEDLAQIRTHTDKSLDESVVFADPTNFICGRADFEEMIKDFRRKCPEAVCPRTSGSDSHNNRYRYIRQISVGQTVFIKGSDFVRLNENALVETVDGFFGDLPRIES